MTEDRDDKIARAGEYAMGLMTGSDVRRFEDDLSRDPDLRAIYADWAEGLVGLDGDGTPPPASVKTQIDKRLFLGASRTQPRFAWLTAKPMMRGLQVAMIVAASVGVYNYMTGPFYDVQAVAQADTIDFDVRLDVDQRVVLISSLSETLPDGRDHELWIIPDGGTPVSLGVMEPRRRVTVPGDFSFDGALIAVTIEAEGGSPTGAPTTAPIAAVAFTSL